MSLYGVLSHCVMFREVWRSMSKNIHDVQNVCLQMILCVYVFFIEIYMFSFNEAHEVRHKLIVNRIWVRNIVEIIPMYNLRVLEEGP